jgi:hypothetical protein
MKNGMGEYRNEVSSHATRARARLQALDTSPWRIEAALGMVLRSIRDQGYVPSWGKRPAALRAAMRIARLSYANGSWYPGSGYEEHVKAAGFDPVSGRITDYERFYEVQEAYESDRNARRQKRLARQ